MIFKLREIREKKGIPMKKMADELGIALSTLSQIEKGNIKLSIDKLEPIANIFDINISELFGEEISNSVRFLKIRYYKNLSNFTFNARDEFDNF
jgi:transcriptional regulator with XRE-family HTH domain